MAKTQLISSEICPVRVYRRAPPGRRRTRKERARRQDQSRYAKSGLAFAAGCLCCLLRTFQPIVEDDSGREREGNGRHCQCTSTRRRLSSAEVTHLFRLAMRMPGIDDETAALREMIQQMLAKQGPYRPGPQNNNQILLRRVQNQSNHTVTVCRLYCAILVPGRPPFRCPAG